MRRLTTKYLAAVCLLAVLALATAASSATSAARAQGGSGVEELWEEFPLERDRPPAESTPAAGRDVEAGRRGAEGTAPVDPAGEVVAGERPPSSASGGEGRDEQPIRALLGLLVVALVAAALTRAIGSSWSTPPATPPPATPPPATLPPSAADTPPPATLPLSAADTIPPPATPPPPAAETTGGAKPGTVMFVEGSTDRDRIGDFSGFVQATVTADEPSGDLLCVEDCEHDRELWVHRFEIKAVRVETGPVS